MPPLTNFDFAEPLIFENGSSGRIGVELPHNEKSKITDKELNDIFKEELPLNRPA